MTARRPASVLAPRLVLAGVGALAAARAIAGAISDSAFAGRCLTGAPTWLSLLGHCPWCWAALAALGLALSPWPQLRAVRVRN